MRKNNKTIVGVTLPSGVVLKRTVSESGLITTEIPVDHKDEYIAHSWAQGIQAFKTLSASR